MPEAGGVGGVRIGVAFNQATLDPTPTWTYLTATPGLVASYTKQSGRQREFDRTDTSRATVTIHDRDGVLDPTNSAGPYYGWIEDLLQIKIELLNPVTDTWQSRFRGFVEDFDYSVDPSQRVTRLQIQCVDLFEILTVIEMQPGLFGEVPLPNGSSGVIFYDNENMDDRVFHVLGDAGIPDAFYVVFSGNVLCAEASYSPGDSVLQVIQDAVDAEFPTVSNAYVDRFGRLCVHGRLAKFDPEGTAATTTTDRWDLQHWKAGDGAAVAASLSDTAQIRAFAYNRGRSRVFNSALCTSTLTYPAEVAGQVYQDAVSIGQRGIRSWSAENLYLKSGLLTGNDANDECLLFATYIVENYKEPRNQITELSFASMHPDDPRAAANWKLLTQCDIADLIDVTETSPGGGGFNLEPCFIEGVNEEVTPATPDYAMVRLSLDVSLRAYFDNPVGLDGV